MPNATGERVFRFAWWRFLVYILVGTAGSYTDRFVGFSSVLHSNSWSTRSQRQLPSTCAVIELPILFSAPRTLMAGWRWMVNFTFLSPSATHLIGSWLKCWVGLDTVLPGIEPSVPTLSPFHFIIHWCHHSTPWFIVTDRSIRRRYSTVVRPSRSIF
jgi:hypothetical protein